MATIDARHAYKYDQALKLIEKLDPTDSKHELILFYIDELKQQIAELRSNNQEYKAFFETLKDFLPASTTTMGGY